MRYTQTAVLLAVFCVALFLGMVGGVAGGSHAGPANDTLDLQDPSGVEVASDLDETAGGTELLVTLSGPASAEGAMAEETTVEQLQARAARSQSDLERFAARTAGVTIKETYWLTNAAVVRVDADRVAPSALARVDGVESIRRNERIRLSVDPSRSGATQNRTAGMSGTTTPEAGVSPDPPTLDRTTVSPTASEQTTVNATYGLRQIGAPEAWQTYNTRGENTTVAVLDTGVDPDHPDIDLAKWAKFDRFGNVNGTAEPQDFDSGGHGTHTSGTVSGGNASGQYIGVAPNTTLHHGAVIPSCEESTCFGFPTQIIGGMEWAVNNSVDVISMSIVVDGYGSSFVDVVENAEASGTSVVVSIGNQGHRTSTSPANVYDSVAVGATNEGRDVTDFSSGERVDTSIAWDNPPESWPGEYVVPDVTAPGAAVKSSIPGGEYDLFWGTSMAAPHVAGAIALIESATGGEYSPDTIETALERTATKPADADVPAGEHDTRYGAGIIDVPAAIAFLTETPSAAYSYQPTRPAPGETITFDGTRSVGNVTGYDWEFGSGPTAATGATPNVTFETPGEYNVTLTVTNATGANDTLTRAVDVRAPAVTRRWSFDTGGLVQSSPTVVTLAGEDSPTVFTGTNNNSVYAIDAATGEQRWRFETDGLVRSVPTVVDGTAYVGSSGPFGSEGRVYALDAETGDLRWRVVTEGTVRSSPTVTDVSTGGSPATGTVFVGSNDGNVSALDAGTGERHWRFQTGDTVRSSPTVANVSAGTGPATGQTVFVGSNDGHVYALDADPTWSNGSHLDGDARWRFETGGPVRSSPTVANVSSGPTTVFVGSDDGHVYALDAATGAKRWEYNTGDPIQSSPTAANLDAGAGADGWTVFVGSGDENLHALNATTGTEQWQFVTGGVVRSSPTVANGTVLVGSDDNRLYAVDGATGEFEWRVFTSGAVEVSPVVVNGTVFVGNLDGNVYALDTDAAASSDGSRVTRGTLGHHYAWADQDVVGPPRVIGGGWPRDPSGDGLFEDVRGDGTVDIFDVQTLFVNLDSPAVQNNAAFYNFQEQNADEVTIFDVQALFTSVTSA